MGLFLLAVCVAAIIYLNWPRRYMCGECFSYAIERRTGYLDSSVCYCFSCQRFTEMRILPKSGRGGE
jgi:hypothetical protein